VLLDCSDHFFPPQVIVRIICKHLMQFLHPMKSRGQLRRDVSHFGRRCAMADALPIKTEIPQFDTYPAESTSDDISASRPSRTYVPRRSRLPGAVPGSNELPGRTRLEQRAVQVGGVVGRAVATVRRGRGKLVVMKSRTQETVSSRNLTDRANELKSSAREWASTAQRLSQVADGARERTSEGREAAREETLQLRERAAENYYGVRLNVQGYINQNPLQALAIIGGTAVVLGATIRIVRSRNAERM